MSIHYNILMAMHHTSITTHPSLMISHRTDIAKINKSIKRIWLIGTDLRRAEDMKSFGQFIGNNPRLKTVSLMACSLGIDSISALSEALLNRSEDVAILKNSF